MTSRYKNLPPLSAVGSGTRIASHWTVSLWERWFYFALFGLAIFHWVLSGFIPPTEDELYYWTWAKNLQWSYYDHPPMVALLIKVSTALWGDNLFGIRFWGTVIHWVVFSLIASLSPGKKVLSLVLGTPLVLYGAILMTPDVPLLLFWTLYLVWLVSINKSFAQWGDDPISRVYRPSPIHWEVWALGGAILGLGLLSKYSMVLAIPCAGLVLWTKYRMRSWFKGFLAHLGIALVVASPILIFNLKYHFAPLQFQWNHSLADGSGVFLEFLGGQVALLGALPLLMLGWVLLRRGDISSHPSFHVCFYFFMFPFVFSLFQSAKTHVEANWAIMSYVAFWPLAQYLLNQNSISILEYLILALGFLPPLVVSVLLGVHLVHPLAWVAPEKDRLAKYQGIYQLAKEVQQDLILNEKTETLFLPTYQMTSYFRFLGMPSEQLYPPGRMSNFTLEPKDPCQMESILVIRDEIESQPESLNCFREKQFLKTYNVNVRGKTVSALHLMEYFK